MRLKQLLTLSYSNCEQKPKTDVKFQVEKGGHYCKPVIGIDSDGGALCVGLSLQTPENGA